MLNSGDNEFVYIGCKESIEKGVLKMTHKELEKCFSDKEIKIWKNKKN